MNTWAVLAAKEAVVASGLGAGLVPAPGMASVDGFALGAVLSGTCLLMLTSARRGQRPLAGAAFGRLMPRARRRSALLAETLGDASREVVAPATAAEESGPAAPGHSQSRVRESGERESGGRDYQSKHRLPGKSAGDKQPETRSQPRHAAPAGSFSARMTRLFTVHPLASGAHS